MRGLRSFLCGLNALVSGLLLLDFVRSPARLLHLSSHAVDGRWLLAIIVRLFLPGIIVVYGASALSYWRRWRSARIWALAAASISFATPFFLAWALAHYANATTPMILQWFQFTALLLIIGALGYIAFWNWDPSSESLRDTAPQRIQGDGTNPVLDKLLWGVALFGYLFGMREWWRWAARAHLPSHVILPGYIAVFIVVLPAVLLHEAGHALCGVAVGMRLRAFIVGPFQWQAIGQRWKFQFHPARFFATGGATAVVPTDPHGPLSQEMKMILAGPLASLAGGLAGLWFVVHAPGHAWEPWWRMIAMFTTISMVGFAGNLIPFQTSDLAYSDGAQIFQLLSGGAWADFHRVVRVLASTANTELRPRDYDIAAIHRAAQGITAGLRGFLLRLIAHSYYLDSRDPESASNELSLAEAIYEGCAAKVPAEWHYAFIVDEAIYRRDAARARLWWNRAEAKKPTLLNGDYWMARSALAWIEGDLGEARSAWSKAQEYLAKMPRTGTYEFDRDCLAALKKTIESAPVATAETTPVER